MHSGRKPKRENIVRTKSLTALFLAAIVALTGGALPAQAAAVAAAGVSWNSSTTAPANAVDLNDVSQISVLQARHAFVKFTTALAVGDTWAVSVSVSKPAGSAITMLDSNGTAAGATSVFTGANLGTWGTPAYASGTGLITATGTAAYSATTFARIGQFAITPDVAGDYEISITAMTDSGSGWQSTSVTQKWALRVYDVITAPATRVQTASFGTGVELDADGNVYWVDSGSKIYKTTTAGVTAQFSLAPTSACKIFVEGSWLYVQGSDQIYRISLSNTNQTATPKLVQGQPGMLSRTGYAQAQGYSRISGQNYVAMNIPRSGEIWRYPTESKLVDVSAFAVTSNVATLTVPSGHGFQAGDTINVYFGGTPSIADAVRTVTSVTSTEVKFAYTSSNVASTATPNGQVAKTVGSSTLLTTVGSAVRGMVPSPDGRYLYIAYGAAKQILRLDVQNVAQAPSVFADLTPVGFAPDDITILDDGSFVVSSFSPGGALWHIGPDGKIMDKISMTLSGTAISNGYDLRMSFDGSKIYLAAQSTGFLSLALSRSLSGSTRGTSNLLQPTSGPIPATVAAASIYDSAASNISTTSALLRGTVNPNGAATQAQLRWSTDPSFPAGSTSSSPIQNLTGNTVQAVDYEATGLSPNTTYYFQLMAGNASTSEVFGGMRSFNTSALPGITSISSNTGAAAGGTTLNLTIQGFSSTPTVRVGGALATNVVFTAPSTLTFDTPAQAGSGIVIESGSLAASAAFVYTAPSISSISPNSGDVAGGFNVTLTGANFTGTTSVSVAGVSNAFSFVSDSSLTFLAPANLAGSRTVQVTTPGGSTTVQLTYLAPNSPSPTPTPTPSVTPTPTPTPSVTPTPAPTQSQAPTVPVAPVPVTPVPVAPAPQKPMSAESVSVGKSTQAGKSKVIVSLQPRSTTAPVESVRVQLKDARGEVLQTLVVPLATSTDSLELEVPMAYGEFDVSVATFNVAGYSPEVTNLGGLVSKNTIAGRNATAWPSVKGSMVLPVIAFEANSAKLTAAAKQQLIAIRNRLKQETGRIYVSGFAARFGPSAKGKKIAEGRALAVARALKAMGLTQWIEFHGYGQLPSPDRSMRKVIVSVQK